MTDQRAQERTLRVSAQRYAAAVARLDERTRERNQAIRDAIAAGMRQSRAGEITGLGRARIGQIVKGAA